MSDIEEGEIADDSSPESNHAEDTQDGYNVLSRLVILAFADYMYRTSTTIMLISGPPLPTRPTTSAVS